MSRKYEIEVEGIPGTLTVVPSLMTRPRLYYGNERLQRSGTKGSASRYRIVADSGREEELLLGQDITGAPTLIFRGRKYPLERPLVWWEWALCLLPLLAVAPFVLFSGALGGALGAFVGVIGTMLCAKFCRAQTNTLPKVAYAAGGALLAFLIMYLVLRLLAALLAV